MIYKNFDVFWRPEADISVAESKSSHVHQPHEQTVMHFIRRSFDLFRVLEHVESWSLCSEELWSETCTFSSCWQRVL